MLGYDVGQHYYNNISPIFNEIWADGYTGEIINDAVFDRNSKTEVLLDIKLEHLFNSNIPNMIKQAVSSSSNDFTAALGSLSGLGSSFEAGELANLMNFENIDTTAEWYDKTALIHSHYSETDYTGSRETICYATTTRFTYFSTIRI